MQNEQDLANQNTHLQTKAITNDKDIQKVQLNKATATAHTEFETYQSGAQISQEMLQNKRANARI